MRSTRHILVLMFLATATLVACEDADVVPPRSLDSPRAVAIARGDVCIQGDQFGGCPSDTEGAVGMVVNEQSDRLGFFELSGSSTELIDLDSTVPGVTHLQVGRLPVDVAASPDGTVGYTLNQLDRDISLVNLYGPNLLEERFHLSETPIEMEVRPESGEVVAVMGSPSALWIHPGASCSDAATCDVPEESTGQILLAGTAIDLVFHPDGSRAYVVYRDVDFMSVVGFAEDAACLDGATPPCIIDEVSLSTGCADGLDNDGDGLIDSEDPQCFSPLGAESPSGVSRSPAGACSDGEDNDEDGAVDRDDLDCVFSGGASESLNIFETVPATACNNTVDDDGDGRIDFPGDPGCYGDVGRTERDLRHLGFDAVDIDDEGIFVYVVDRARNQVIVVDATRNELVDAAATADPPGLAFTDEVGVPVSPSPLSVAGIVRDIFDQDGVRIGKRFGAYVAADTGFLQFVEVARNYCTSIDDNCLFVPSLPLRDLETRADAGDETLPQACSDCADCRADEDADCVEACAVVDATDELYCRRGFEFDGTRVTFNPIVTVRDATSANGRVVGKSTCEIPVEVNDDMTAFTTQNPQAPQNFDCDSPLLPQPLSVASPDVDEETQPQAVDIEELPRADLEQLRRVLFEADDAATPALRSQPYDVRLRNERWTVTYEGILPGTARSDGVLATETSMVPAPEEGADDLEVVHVDTGGMNVCGSGVEPGDVFIIRSTPADGVCDDLVSEDEEFLTYRVVDFDSSGVTITTTDDDEFAGTLPIRECFEEALRFEIRATDEWVAVGERSGFVSDLQTLHGECVPRFQADRRNARVETGGILEGPYFEFRIYEGFVDPARDLSFEFLVEPNFTSDRLDTSGILPVYVAYAPGMPGGDFLISVDSDEDFVYFNDLNRATGAFLIR